MGSLAMMVTMAVRMIIKGHLVKDVDDGDKHLVVVMVGNDGMG